MARKEVVVSALQALTSNEFEASDFSNNASLHVLVTEYFAGRSDETNDEDVISSDEEMSMFKVVLK